MKLEKLTDDLIGKSCICKSRFESHGTSYYQEYYITNITKIGFNYQDWYWTMDANFFMIEKSNSDSWHEMLHFKDDTWTKETLGDCDFEFMSREEVIEKLQNRIKIWMNE